MRAWEDPDQVLADFITVPDIVIGTSRFKTRRLLERGG